MLFFPSEYPDELLFSLLSRYFVRSGNISYKGTLDDLFSNRSLTASISFPSGINSLVKNMPPFSQINEEHLINRNTLYLFYTAFLPYVQAKKIYQSMCSDDGKGIYVRSGINASGVSQNEFLRFCKECTKEDIENYGELYWHRSHQISGIHCCLEHFTPLYNSSEKVIGSNKHRFQIPTLENCSANKSVLGVVSQKTRTEYIRHCKKLATSILQLMNQPFERQSVIRFDQKYRNKLAELDLAYYTGRVKQKAWRDHFQQYYGKEVLQLFCSQLKGNQDWLSLIVQKNRKSFHPIRHLLVISALDMTVEDLFNSEISQPFGYPNWPCQNKVCDHYNVPVIENVSITLCEKTKKPIGTFTCTVCEFSYTRRGPDKNEDDKFRRTRVKSYGSLWETKLQEFSKLSLGLRELSRRMGADPNTIKRFLNDEKEGSLKVEQSKDFVKENRQSWLSLQRQYPQKSIKQLREVEKALYMRLYRDDKEWLKANSPNPLKKTSTTRIDWNKRDDEILEKVKGAVESLLNPNNKPVRVTIGKVGYLIGERALFEKKFDKLQRTKRYLQEKVETVEQFTERRIEYVIDDMYKNNEELKTWIILRKSGIKDWDLWRKAVEAKIKSKGYFFID